MNLELFDLPFVDGPFDEELAKQMVQETEAQYDTWLESLRS